MTDPRDLSHPSALGEREEAHESLHQGALAQEVFNALAVGGSVTMPMQQTFWVESFGMVDDQFGLSWMVNGGQPSM